MGAHAYCTKCGHPLDMPTIKDAVDGAQPCPRCDERRPLDDMDRRWAMEAFMEDYALLVRRVEDLEVHRAKDLDDVRRARRDQRR